MKPISRFRRQTDLKRKQSVRKPYDRILVVCEGAKTEPNYFNEIRRAERLSSAFVKIIPSQLGTQPLKIIESAIAEFKKTSEFDQVFVVFDRDDHPNYANAIAKAEAQDKKMRNDEKNPVRFEAIVSVPSFELWLLLHYENVQAWLPRNEILKQVKTHIKNYEKGMPDIFAQTKSKLETACQRGAALREEHSRLSDNVPYTDVHELVQVLLSLKR